MSGTRNIVAALCQRWYGGSAEATLVYCLAVGGGGGGGVVATMHWSGRIVYESEFSGRPNPSMDDGQTAELVPMVQKVPLQAIKTFRMEILVHFF